MFVFPPLWVWALLTFLSEINKHNGNFKYRFSSSRLGSAGRWQLFELSAKTDGFVIKDSSVSDMLLLKHLDLPLPLEEQEQKKYLLIPTN